MLSLEVRFLWASSKHYLLTRNRWNCRTRSGQSLNRKSKRFCSCSRSWCQVRIQLVIALSAHTDIILFPSDQGIFQIQVPFLGPTVLPSRFASSPFLFRVLTFLLDTPLDWNYTIVPQAGMNGRTFAYPRGKLLGGSSSASKPPLIFLSEPHTYRNTQDYLFHQYGTDEDWNRISSVSGDAGWSWSNMKQYIQKVNGIQTIFACVQILTRFTSMRSLLLQ